MIHSCGHVHNNAIHCSYMTSCVIFMKEEGYEEERLEAADWTGVKVCMYVSSYI